MRIRQLAEGDSEASERSSESEAENASTQALAAVKVKSQRATKKRTREPELARDDDRSTAIARDEASVSPASRRSSRTRKAVLRHDK